MQTLKQSSRLTKQKTQAKIKKLYFRIDLMQDTHHSLIKLYSGGLKTGGELPD